MRPKKINTGGGFARYAGESMRAKEFQCRCGVLQFRPAFSVAGVPLS
jgi:hypothetical protein